LEMGIPNKDKGKETRPLGERSGGERSEPERAPGMGTEQEVRHVASQVLWGP
jgi:hypothetical protein